jgi:uracil-DNA glycosylase family 4
MTTTKDDDSTTFDDVKNLSREQRWARYAWKHLVPMDHPLIPAAGPDFARTVLQLTESKVSAKMARDDPAMIGLEHLYRNALYKRKWQLQVSFKGQFVNATFLRGGRWSLPPFFNSRNSSVNSQDYEWVEYRKAAGPRYHSDVMIIGKHPGAEELTFEQNFIGQSSEPLHRALRELGVSLEARSNWYVTNTVKFNRLDPTSGTMQQAWLKNCAPLLWQEILLVRPKFIACLGTEAIRAVLGKGFTVGNMTGRVVEMKYNFPPFDAETHAAFDDLGSYGEQTVQIIGMPHPAYIFRMQEAYPDLLSGLRQLTELIKGERPQDIESTRDHSVCYTPKHLARVIDNILEKASREWDSEIDGDLPIAWDAEWHGRHPGDPGSYLRTIQFSVGGNYRRAPMKATCVGLSDQGGGLGRPTTELIARELRRLIDGRHSNGEIHIKTRHGGHFFKADIPWIREFLGIDFAPLWTVPSPQEPGPKGETEEQRRERLPKRINGVAYRKKIAKFQIEEDANAEAEKRAPVLVSRDLVDRNQLVEPHEPWEMTRYTGGFDTGYMTHAVFEATESFDLEQLAMRWTTIPRWSVDVEEAKVRIAKEMGIKLRDLGGYGDIPDNVLVPYALYDADATLRLFWRFNFARTLNDGDGFLDQDVWHKSSREPYWRTMLAGLTFLEMEETGVTVDVDRGKELIKVFELVKERLTTSLREELNWPSFNPNSPAQVRAWLFGEEFSRVIDKKTGKNRPQMPDPEMKLGKVPIKTTGKPSRSWGTLNPRDKQLLVPAVDKEVLGIFAHTDDRVKKLRDIRYIRQVLQSVLRPPKIGEAMGAEANGSVVFDEADEFDGGFLSYVNTRDSRVRSRFYPVETGRCSSSGPNLQNLAKRREDDYARILGHVEDGEVIGDYTKILGAPLYKNPIRSIVTAGEWDDVPTVLMEFDIIAAEIAALAWESGDEKMIEDVNRAMLPEDDPDFLDLHSSTAVEAFKLSCDPNKKALKALGKPGLRVAAKNVRFGVPYGRSAEALSRQCREEGADVSVQECQRLIDNYYKRYPAASSFLAECEARPGSRTPYLVGAFGRMRRFGRVDDKSAQADQGRSAKNYPIQNLVADAILLGMYNLRQLRINGFRNKFRTVLQIHDAVMLEVKIPHIEEVREAVVLALSDDVEIMPRTLDGIRFDDKKKMEAAGRGGRCLEKPYHFKVDCSVFLNWGQAIDPERGRSLGIPDEYLGK